MMKAQAAAAAPWRGGGRHLHDVSLAQDGGEGGVGGQVEAVDRPGEARQILPIARVHLRGRLSSVRKQGSGCRIRANGRGDEPDRIHTGPALFP